MLAKLRRRIADLVLGGQTVLFVSKDQKTLMDGQSFLDLDDGTLGKMFRRWWGIVSETRAKLAEEDGDLRPFESVMISGCVLYLASYARKMGADTASFTVGGSVDGGKTEQVFNIAYKALPDDYEFGDKAVVIERDPNDPDKITKLSISNSNPGYDAWKAEQAA